VVIVDDEKSYVSLLREVLEQHLDCRIDVFTRPRDALEAIPQLHVGVVVTDFSMPQLNGIQFIQKAAALVPSAPFILITGHPAGMIDDEALRDLAPLKAVLLKPFRWRRLADEIVRLWPEPAERNHVRRAAHH
jgi:DNA-binding NtrC family response regulator